MIHHAAATAAALVGRRAIARLAITLLAIWRGLLLVLVVMLLDSVFSDASHDGSTNSAEDAVVGLVTGETAREAARDGSSESALTLLGIARGALVRRSNGRVSFQDENE